MTSDDLLREYHGHIVPQTYNAGFVALSFVVSLVGSASTLELINRRTGFRGLFNHLLLVSSAITMGGIAIWCMHFIGNRAIDLADRQPELQVAYSSGFTAISFFVPILVLLAAFVAIGTNNTVSWWRVVIGGVLCGTAVCGMHYLGNASIANYTCVYNLAFVTGSAVIAVVASIVALAMFFVFRATWANSWWKRGLSSIVLAGAVSGMHWCAAIGTRYRLTGVKPSLSEPSRSATVIVVICLSLGACFIIAGSAILRARSMRRSAMHAQKVTLGAAVFDRHGRILVDPDGFLPATVVTGSFVEKGGTEGFSISHKLFHWMFHASRNWAAISKFLPNMKQHLLRLPHSSRDRDGRHGVQLINEHWETIEDYDVVMRELFCVAASSLANRLGHQLTSMGVLWDEILPTGDAKKRPRARAPAQRNAHSSASSVTASASEEEQASMDRAEKGLGLWGQNFGYARGSLMFLAHRMETDREAEQLVALGYRFAELHQVSEIIRSSMQIQTRKFETKLRDLAAYSTRQNQTLPGVHLGIFAIRARLNSQGFEVLVQKGARNLLPSMPLSIQTLELWHVDFLRRFESTPLYQLVEELRVRHGTWTSAEIQFAEQLSDALEALRKWVQEPLLEDAILTSTIVRIPCRDDEGNTPATQISLRLVVPIHSVLTSPQCEFVPLNFFRMHQAPKPSEQEFSRDMHRDFGAALRPAARDSEDSGASSSGPSLSKMWPFRHIERIQSNRSDDKNRQFSVRERQMSGSDSVQSDSTINLCAPASVNGTRISDREDQTPPYGADDEASTPAPSYGGIMVFQEVTVDVESGQSGDATSQAAGIELQKMGHIGTNVQGGRSGHESGYGYSYVDVLFSECVESRQ